MKSLIEAAGLTKSYGRKRGVIDLSFDVAEGEVFGFLGPNGAGKTTTIRLLMGLLFANSGEARIAGLECWRQSVQVKRLVGYLPGELALDPNLTGGQILAYFANLRGGVDKTYLEGLVARLGLDTSRRFRHYSHGNKQKVGLIQAFMHRPRLLMLDEPTSGLDPLNQHEFDRMVAEVRAEGRTVFLSSHILSEVGQEPSGAGGLRDGTDWIGCGGIRLPALRLATYGGRYRLPGRLAAGLVRHHATGIVFPLAGPAAAALDLRAVRCAAGARFTSG
jgi:ABC-2 type transport system ATP-binding protein